MAERDWRDWRRAMFGEPYLVWHDGPDFRQLLPAATAAPDTVFQMLTAGLESQDHVAALAFEFLTEQGRALPGATEALRAAAGAAGGQFLVYVARALYTSTAEQSWAEPIAAVLSGEDSTSVRLDAARALASFPPTADLIASVARAVCDCDYLVRFHAANTLQRYAGIARDIAATPRFRKLCAPVHGEPNDTDRRLWQEVADELTAAASDGATQR